MLEVLAHLQVLHESLRHFLLDVLADVVADRAVPIANTEEVHPEFAHNVGQEYVAVLVDFSQIIRVVACRSRVRKLSDAVEALTSRWQATLGDRASENWRFVLIRGALPQMRNTAERFRLLLLHGQWTLIRKAEDVRVESIVSS